MRDPKRNTTVTIVEGATRYWLSAQVMIACILLGMIALALQSSRSSVTDFPNSLNSTCSGAIYTIQVSMADSLEIIIDDTQNITNKQYQKIVRIFQKMAMVTTNMTIKGLLLAMKQINPLMYCTMNAGLGMASVVKMQLTGLENSPFSCQLPLVGNVDPCKDLSNQFNTVVNGIHSVVNQWPTMPNGLADALNQISQGTGFSKYVEELANLDIPENILNLNSSKIVAGAMVNLTGFAEANATCMDMSVKFKTASDGTALAMYYVEIALWVSVVLLLLGIFLFSIIRQFPAACTKWLSAKISSFTQSYENKLQALDEKASASSSYSSYFVWILKYVNFRMALLTTSYGLIGFCIVFGLTAATDRAQVEVNVWVESELGPSMNKIQDQLQNAFNQAILNLEAELNAALKFASENQKKEFNDVLGQISQIKDTYMNATDDVLANIGFVPEVGPIIANSIQCVLPMQIIPVLDDATDLLLGLMSAMLDLEVDLPIISFPYVAGIATRSTHTAISFLVTSLQDELKTYQIIFIVLTIAIGILLLQGIIFIGIKESILRINKRRYVTHG